MNDTIEWDRRHGMMPYTESVGGERIIRHVERDEWVPEDQYHMTTIDTAPAPWDDPVSRKAAAEACLRGEPVVFGFDIDGAVADGVGTPDGWVSDGRPVHVIANRVTPNVPPALAAERVAE